MEDIRVDEYVRTINGLIFKVDKEKKMLQINEFQNLFGERNIKNHSYRLADLAEPGDIGVMDCYGLQVKKFLTQDDILELKFKNYELLGILTKEQFNREKYVVEVNNG